MGGRFTLAGRRLADTVFADFTITANDFTVAGVRFTVAEEEAG